MSEPNVPNALPQSVADLVAAEQAGTRLKYVYFWGHTPRADGEVRAECLSQWVPSRFTVEGVDYATAEHWMMWSKARLFGDAEAAERVLAASHPKQAKDIGGQVRGFDEAAWLANRSAIVTEGNVAKFAQNPEMLRYLLGTGDRILVEASPMDRIWGIGLAADDPRAERPASWRGSNLLGFALMAARRTLAAR